MASMAPVVPDETEQSDEHVPLAKDGHVPGSMTDAQQSGHEKTDSETKEQATKEESTEEKTHELVPVNMEAADAAELALAEFMASESLAGATLAVSASPVTAVAPDPIWKSVDEAFKAPTCRKCLMPCTLENLVNKTKAEGRVNVVCKGCNSATTMLSRRLGQWPVPAFNGLTQDQQVGFWKQCHNIIQRQGRLDYGSIRACLSISLAERQSEIAKAKFTSEYLPLSVWTTRGFKEEDVRKGLKEDHPLLGETFAVPLKTVSKEHIRERVEEMITNFEAQVSKKKDAKASASLPAPSATATPMDDAEDTDLLNITWLDAKSPGKKRPLEDEPQEEVPIPDPKRERQMANELRRHNTAVSKFAQKGLDALNPLMGALMKHQANLAVLPASLVSDLNDVQSALGELICQCQDGLKTPGVDERLPDLPFDSKSLATKTKGFKQVFSNVDRMMKLINKSAPKKK